MSDYALACHHLGGVAPARGDLRLGLRHGRLADDGLGEQLELLVLGLDHRRERQVGVLIRPRIVLDPFA